MPQVFHNMQTSLHGAIYQLYLRVTNVDLKARSAKSCPSTAVHRSYILATGVCWNRHLNFNCTRFPVQFLHTYTHSDSRICHFHPKQCLSVHDMCISQSHHLPLKPVSPCSVLTLTNCHIRLHIKNKYLEKPPYLVIIHIIRNRRHDVQSRHMTILETNIMSSHHKWPFQKHESCSL